MSNPRGITPSTSAGAPFTSTVRPITPASPPNALCHRPYDSTSTPGPFGSDSSAVYVRPYSGATPSASNRSAVAIADVTRIGASPPPMLNWPVRYPPIAAYARLRSFSSRYSGGEIQNLSNPSVGNWL